MKRLMQLIKKIFSYKFVRFLFAGGLNTLFSYACFAVLMLIINQKEIVTTLNYIISVTFNYFTSSKIVFKEFGFSPLLLVKFYGTYVVTYIINLIHLHITVDIWGWNVYFSEFITLFYIPIISFVLQRTLVFRKSKRSPNDISSDTEQKQTKSDE